MQASERMVAVRISYKKLWMLLLERDIKKASLRHEVPFLLCQYEIHTIQFRFPFTIVAFT